MSDKNALILVSVEGLSDEQKNKLIAIAEEQTDKMAFFGAMGDILIFAPTSQYASLSSMTAGNLRSLTAEFVKVSVNVLFLPCDPDIRFFGS